MQRRTPDGLSRGLHQSLRRGLYKGLHQGMKPRTFVAADAGNDDPGSPPIDPGAGGQASSLAISEATGAATGLEVKVRQVSLLSGETLTHAFCPEKGLVSEPLERGRMLVLTNQRVIAFGQANGMRETVLMPVDEVKAVAVNAGRRSKGMLFQGGLMVMAGVFFYVLLAYWLTGQLDGPTVPIIRMDLVAFLVFLGILTGIGLMAQFYFGKTDGEVTFQGDGVKVTFPFKGETAEGHIYQVVNAAFAARQAIVRYSGLGVK